MANQKLTALAAAASVLSTDIVYVVTDPSGTPTSNKATLSVVATRVLNGLTVTASTGVLTIANLKTLTVSNTLTLTATDGSTAAFGAGGTVTYTSNNLSVFAATTSAQLAGVISDETGSGLLVFATSPTLTTPILGVAAYTSLAGGVITQTSASATAFESGPNGGTNPVLRLVNSVASQTAGVSITGNASAAGVTFQALGGTNEFISLLWKGTSGIAIGPGTGTPTYGLQLTATSGLTAGQTAYFRDMTPTTGKTTIVIRAGAVTGNALEIQRNSDGNIGFKVTDAGVCTASGINAGGAVVIPASSYLQLGVRALIFDGSADGNLKLTDFNGTSFGLLQLGGTTTSFPAIKRSTTTVQIRLADDSAFALLNCLSITTNSTTLHTTAVALTDGAGASVGTLTNAPAAGNPTKWVPIVDNGTTRYIPAW